jgi:hypothetical protein
MLVMCAYFAGVRQLLDVLAWTQVSMCLLAMHLLC